ncbi:MAG: hypothetical protein K1X63_15020 [Chitinophagales bacterium]|nr:hypothetical protein [Chitinophagales bacterium]
MKSWRNVILIMLIVNGVSQGQQPVGLNTDNYLPASSILFNPAAAFTSPFAVDINVASIDALAYNNLAFANHLSLLSLAFGQANGMEVSYGSPETIRAFSDISLQGPSAVIRYSDFSFGLITQVRSAASLITDVVPPNLDFNNILEDSLYQFPASRFAGLNWSEAGVHFGFSKNASKNLQVSIGATVKYLIGSDGISAITSQPLDFIKHAEESSMSFNQVIMRYGYTSGFGEDIQHKITRFGARGSGIGTDIGFMISRGQDATAYSWKAGVSLMDAGFISFSNDVQRYRIQTDTAVTVTQQEFNTLNSADDFTALAAGAIEGKGTMTAESGPLKIWLPAALSFQGEVAVSEQFYLNAAVVQRMPLADQQVQRPNSVTLTPRFESRWWSAGIPLDLNDYHKLQVGGFFRFGPAVVGTDNLAAAIIPSKFEGADIYFGLHFFFSDIRSGGAYKSGSLGCPKFR